METRRHQNSAWLRGGLVSLLLFLGVIGDRQARAQAVEDNRLATPPSTAALAQSLAPNPGFEEPDLAGYHIQVSAELDSKRAFQGRFSVRHDAVAGHAWNCVQMAEGKTIPIEPGKLCHLSVWSRNTLTGSGAKFGLRQINAKDKSISYIWGTVPPGLDTWRRYDLTMRPVAEAVALQIYFYVPSAAKNGSIWWDAVMMSAVEDPFAGGAKPAAQIQIAPIDSTVIVLKDGKHEPDRLTVAIDASRGVAGGEMVVEVRPEHSTSPDAPALLSVCERVKLAGPLMTVLPLNSLPLGRYQLRLRIRNADDSTEFRTERTLAVVRPLDVQPVEPIRTSRATPHGLLVNDRPFLSMMYYHNPIGDLEAMAELRRDYGATTAQVWGGNSIDRLVEHVDALYRLGIYSWAVLFHPAMCDLKAKKWKTEQLIETVERLKNHPGLIGWDLIDEPDGHGTPPAEVKRAADLVRQHDPNHVIWVNLCFIDRFKEYAGLSDLASYDTYPICRGLGLDVIQRYNRAILDSVARDKPLLSVLETYAWAGMPHITPAQLRAMTYLNIRDGMTIFHFYSWHDPAGTTNLANTPILRNEARLLAHELHELRPFLFSDRVIEAQIEAPNNERCVCLAKQVGKQIVLVVVNTTSEPCASCRVTLPGSKISSAVGRFDPAFRPRVANGELTVSLPSYGVGVLEVE